VLQRERHAPSVDFRIPAVAQQHVGQTGLR
jgi:hypothetical protein